jgi:hypothetical protein
MGTTNASHNFFRSFSSQLQLILMVETSNTNMGGSRQQAPTTAVTPKGDTHLWIGLFARALAGLGFARLLLWGCHSCLLGCLAF